MVIHKPDNVVPASVVHKRQRDRASYQHTRADRANQAAARERREAKQAAARERREAKQAAARERREAKQAVSRERREAAPAQRLAAAQVRREAAAQVRREAALEANHERREAKQAVSRERREAASAQRLAAAQVRREAALEAKQAVSRERREAAPAQRLAAAQVRHQQIADSLSTLAETILDKNDIDAETIQLLAKSQNFAKDPRLALLYFHLCSTNPDAFVFNDECLQGPDGKAVCERIRSAIGGPVGQDDAVRCQQSAAQTDTGSGRIAVCASCNEILFENDNNIKDAGHISTLPPQFLLNDHDLEELSQIPAEVIDEHVQVLKHAGRYYYLNPDLVPDFSNVVLCKTCTKNPTGHKYSLANGHDYGCGLQSLPKLTPTMLNAILPARAFNINILIRPNHSTAHSIVFPSDGPVEVAKVLPHATPDQRPQVTFLGSRDAWRKAKGRYRSLYELDVSGTYSWLRTWVALGHPQFADIEIDNSGPMHERLATEAAAIENDAIANDDTDIAAMSAHMDFEDNDDIENTGNTTIIPDLVHAAVLPKPSLINSGINTALTALCDIILPNEDNDSRGPPIAPISRPADPVNEWDENDRILAGAFAHLFLRGKGVPKGSLAKDFLRHLFLYYDGRFEDPMFIATAFNQLQRHACIRQTARVSVKRQKQLEALGALANSNVFRQRLVWARDHPNSDEAKRMNAKVCRIMSMVGSSVPFSPFERASTRPKLSAMRLRYGIGSYFLTGAPPEFEDLTVLRLASLRQEQTWNNPACTLQCSGATRNDLPGDLSKSASARLQVTRPHPVLAAISFACRMKILFNDVLRCPLSSATRVSRNYLERQRGAFLEVAAAAGVTEPQKGGRLHWHMTAYASVLSPELLTRLAAAPEELQREVARVLDSISCTHLPPGVRKWYNDVQGQDTAEARPRAADLPVPDAASDYGAFIDVLHKKAALLMHHVHGFSCEKPPKGLFMCHLCMGRGIHEGRTCPLLIALHARPDHKTHRRADIVGMPLDAATIALLDRPYEPMTGELIRPHTIGPVAWEMHRPATDTMLVESNLLSIACLGCHNNASVISGRESGEAAEQYESAYMTKEGAPLRQAAAMLLAAMDDIAYHPSIADDTGTVSRTGKHLASRTVNAFSGSHQWSMPLMVHALLGFTSENQTDAFRYVFPHAAVAYVDQLQERLGADDDSARDTVDEEKTCDADEAQMVDDALDSLMYAVDHNEKSNEHVGGATVYKLQSGQAVFLSQAESYDHRGPLFRDYSALEFESIVELKPCKSQGNTPRLGAGRPSRAMFPLDPGHPLYGEYEAVIHVKFRTAVLAGRPPPTFPGNKPSTADRVDDWQATLDMFAKYVIDLLVPWQGKSELMFTRDGAGLADLLDKWDRSTATLVNRQRFRQLNNLMNRGYRNSRNELTTNFWRERNADYWADIKSA